MARNYIIDEDEVEHRLTSFATYAGQFYQGLSRGELIASLYFGASLTGTENKSFGKLPTFPLSSFSVPMHRLPNPLKVPEPPLQISRADLAAPASIARRHDRTYGSCVPQRQRVLRAGRRAQDLVVSVSRSFRRPIIIVQEIICQCQSSATSCGLVSLTALVLNQWRLSSQP